MGNRIHRCCEFICLKNPEEEQEMWELKEIILPETDLESEEEEPLFLPDFLESKLSVAVAQLKSIISQPFCPEDFTPIGEKQGVTVASNEKYEGYFVKFLCQMPFNADQLADFLINHDRKLWDSSIEHISTVAQPSADIFIHYIKFKKVMMISSRDILIASKVVRIGKDTLIASTSLEHDKFSSPEEVIRAKLDVAGYFIQPIKPHENLHSVLTVISGSFGGNLPHALVRKTMEIHVPKNLRSMISSMKKTYQ